MNFDSSLKKIICFLLAVLMLVSTAGCKQETKKKKKKVIIKQQVIVKPGEEDNNNSQNNSIVETPKEDTDTEPEKQGLPERPLPEVAIKDEAYVEWKEPIVPEFDYDYASLNITSDYVIVYAFEEWENRKESATLNADGSISDRYINYTGFARLAAYDLQTYFKDKLNLKLDVQKDTSVDADAKKILVGDTAFYTSDLDENEFAVKVKGDDLIFEGGHFVMVNKAVKWYETVEVKAGQVATLSGVSDDFKSQITLNGITYDYVWGDEFDGYEFNNSESWIQTKFGDVRSDDFANVFNDPHFQYVENGRLRLTADRYYDEGNAAMGYASSGDLCTDGKMQFRNGYFEVRARFPYRRGAFPALWTMSNPKNELLPNYNFNDGYGQISKCFWTIEFDLFESFASSDIASTTIHKWYDDTGIGSITIADEPIALTDAQVKELSQRAYKAGYHYWVNDTYMSKYMFTEENLDKLTFKVDDKYAFDSGIMSENELDSDGNVIGKKFIYYPTYLNFDDGTSIDIFNYRKRPFTNMNKSSNNYAYSFTYPATGSENITGNVKNGKYDWKWQFDAETINKEYHTYAFHYTSNHCTVYMDGKPYVDFDWDPAFDYFDVNGDGFVEDVSRNNNGVGYNLWHYFIIDMMIYTPNNFNAKEERKLKKGDYPFNLYIDWVRCYQDLDDPSQAIWFPNGEAD